VRDGETRLAARPQPRTHHRGKRWQGKANSSYYQRTPVRGDRPVIRPVPGNLDQTQRPFLDQSTPRSITWRLVWTGTIEEFRNRDHGPIARFVRHAKDEPAIAVAIVIGRPIGGYAPGD
jgi:hypothetical protein